MSENKKPTCLSLKTVVYCSHKDSGYVPLPDIMNYKLCE